MTIRRNANRLYGREFACAQVLWIDQKLIFAVGALPHIDARLLLAWKPFPEEITATDNLHGIVGFDVEEFADAVANAITSWDAIQIGSREACLLLKPLAREWRISILKPAIWIRNWNAMQNIRHWLGGREWRS